VIVNFKHFRSLSPEVNSADCEIIAKTPEEAKDGSVIWQMSYFLETVTGHPK
jgi:hypothetical protein